jgi:drug/metabolite transporter (DMT)-like permease
MTSGYLLRKTSPHTQALMMVSFAVVVLSFDSLLIRLLIQTLSFTDVILWRGVGTAVGFSVIAWLVARRGLWRAAVTIGRAGVVVAVLNLFGNALFVTAITHTTVAHALVIISITPMLTAILSQVFLGERASARVWLVSLVIALGVCLVFLAIPSQGDLAGDVAAVGGAFFFSLTFVVLRHARRVNMMPAFALGGILTAAAAAPFATRFSLSPREAVIAFLLGVVVVPLSLGLVTRGLRNLQAPEVSLLLLLETILGPLWVLIALRETPDLRTILSGSVILLALISNSVAEWQQLRNRRVDLEEASANNPRAVQLTGESTPKQEGK